MSAIQCASREVAAPSTFSDFDRLTNNAQSTFKTAVSSQYPIPEFARLLLSEESGKISEIVLLLVL